MAVVIVMASLTLILPTGRGYGLNTFGDWLRQKRRDRGLTLEDMEERSGLSYVTIGDWERGKRNPRRDNIEPVILALRYEDQDQESIEALVDEALVAAGFAPKYQQRDPERAAFSGLYEGLSPGGKRRAVDMLKLLQEAEQEAAIGGRGYKPDQGEETGDTDPEA